MRKRRRLGVKQGLKDLRAQNNINWKALSTKLPVSKLHIS
jgi:hypothetical protein